MGLFSLVLGSSSKWRKGILSGFLGSEFPFTTLNPDIDEKAIRHSDPRKMTLAIARAKAEALKTKVNASPSSPPSFLICSDQVIVCRGEVREKPVDEAEARTFLRSYRDAPAEAVDAVVIYNTQTGLFFEGIATGTQHFKELPETFIDQLIAKGDVLSCAGGFVVEEMAAYLGEREGELETIQGMPIALTLELLHLAGLNGLPPLPAAIANDVSYYCIRIPCEGPHGIHKVAVHVFDPPRKRNGEEEKKKEKEKEEEGRVTLCVHGLSRNAFDFEVLARTIAKGGQRVLAVDLPGRGLSEWFEHSQDYNYPQYLSDLHTILTTLGYISLSNESGPKVDWIGTSLGGLLGMYYVGIHPGVVRRLLMNDIGPVVPLAGLLRLSTYVGEKVQFTTLQEVEDYFRSKFAPFGKLTDEEWRRIAVHSVVKSDCSSSSSPWILSYDPAIGDPFKDPSKLTADIELWPVWEKIAAGLPILLLRGERSDLLALKTVEEMIKRRPGPGLARFHQFEDCGHAPSLFSSSQIQVVLDFFFSAPTESLSPLETLPSY